MSRRSLDDATHSELHHGCLEEHPDEAMPWEAWGGVAAERFRLSCQMEVLVAIAGPQHEIDHLAAQTGTHCDVDADGDDYKARDW